MHEAISAKGATVKYIVKVFFVLICTRMFSSLCCLVTYLGMYLVIHLLKYGCFLYSTIEGFLLYEQLELYHCWHVFNVYNITKKCLLHSGMVKFQIYSCIQLHVTELCVNDSWLILISFYVIVLFCFYFAYSQSRVHH